MIGSRVTLSAQIAVCLVLLVCAGLLLRTLRNYATENLGIDDSQGVLVFGVTPQGGVDEHAFYRRLLDRVRQLPGVESVSLAENRPTVQFKACGNTQENKSKLEKKKVSLVAQASVVPSGVVRIIELQEQGWSYIRP